MGFATIDGLPVDFRSHHHPHLDELLAREAIIRCADAGWIRSNASGNEDGRYAINLGVLGGSFDEHAQPKDKTERKKKETAASLVFKSLGLFDHPLFKAVLEYAIPQDLRGKGSRNDLGNFLKTWTYVRVWKQQGAESDLVNRWFATALEALLYTELLRQSGVVLTPGVMSALQRPFQVGSMSLFIRLHQNAKVATAWRRHVSRIRVLARQGFLAARDELIAAAKTQEVTAGDRKVTICVYHGDNPFALRAYRSEGAPGGEVFMQFKSTGHILIAATSRSRLRLDWAVTLLRSSLYGTLVQQNQVVKSDVPRAFRLRYEGTLPGAPHIYFMRGDARQIHNSTPTHPHVPPLIKPAGPMPADQCMKMLVEGLRRELADQALPQKPEPKPVQAAQD